VRGFIKKPGRGDRLRGVRKRCESSRRASFRRFGSSFTSATKIVSAITQSVIGSGNM
jgi:hypothetical protein